MARVNLKELIPEYDTLTPEQRVAAYEALDLDDKADEIERYKNAASKANSEAAESKRKLKEKMGDDERKAAEEAEAKAETARQLEEANSRIAALEKEKTEATYKSSYLAMGYSEENAKKAAAALAAGETDKVFEIQKLHQAECEQAYKAENAKNFPDLPNGTGGNKMTKEEFLKLPTDKQVEYKNANPNWMTELK